MKKLLTILVTGMFAISFLTAIAQENIVALNKKQNTGLFADIDTFSSNTAVVPVTVTTRVIRNFMKDFPGISGTAWSKNGSGYVVRFSANGIQHWAFLTRKGHCHGTMRYYHEEGLPAYVRTIVKSNYYDFTIASVKEVSTGSDTAYLVTIEDKATWKVVRIVDREMDIYEEHVKSTGHK